MNDLYQQYVGLSNIKIIHDIQFKIMMNRQETQRQSTLEFFLLLLPPRSSKRLKE